MDRLQPDLAGRRAYDQRQRRGDRALNDRGTGLIGTIGGVSIFLAFLFFAVQLLFNLYATSVVTSAAYEGARTVAGHDVDHTDAAAVARAQVGAEDRMRSMLGQYGDRVTFEWGATAGGSVTLRVQARNPRLVFGGLGGQLGFNEIDRTVTVRVEEPR